MVGAEIARLTIRISKCPNRMAQYIFQCRFGFSYFSFRLVDAQTTDNGMVDGMGADVETISYRNTNLWPGHVQARRRSMRRKHLETLGQIVDPMPLFLIEQGFGWAKFIGPIRQVMVRGIKKVDQVFMMAMAAYNLVRMRTLGQVRLEVA